MTMPDRPLMEKIGKYEIVELIGRGAMGIVFKGYDPALGRHVAIKVMTTHFDIDSELRERFLREAQAAGSLQHPNVITVFELGESDGMPYIAMEYLPGRDLEDIIEEREPLTVVEKVDLIEQVCRGLAYAHERGVVHRDVKPANIRVSQLGQVKLMDFGIAHLVSSEITATGSLLGTPYYMAPEVVDGKTIDLRADIFSVGATFYELLAYERPFAGPDLHHVFNKILNSDPAPLDRLGLEIPPSIQKVLDRSLAKHPPDRYPNLGAMLKDLSNFWDTIPGNMSRVREAATTSLGRTASRAGASARRARGRKNRKRIGMVASALAIVAVGFFLWRTFAPQLLRGPEPEPLADQAEVIRAALPEETPPDRAETVTGGGGGEGEGGDGVAGVGPGDEVPAAQPEPEAPPRPTRAAVAAAAARAAYPAVHNSAELARNGAARVDGATLQPSLFGQAESDLAAGVRAARSGRYEAALVSLRSARRDFAAASRNAVAIWQVRLDSASSDVSGLAASADRASPEYSRGIGFLENAIEAREAGDYPEALRYYGQAAAAYERARPEQPAEVEPVTEPALSPREISAATLEELRGAIEAESLDRVRAVWVNLSSREARSFSAFFDLARDLEVGFRILDLSATPDRIEVRVETTYNFFNEDERRQANQKLIQIFQLARRGDRWLIVDSED